MVLSLLARVLPGMQIRPEDGAGESAGAPARDGPPEDPFDRSAVREWQARRQAPAAFEEQTPASGAGSSQSDARVATPAGALAQPTAPGPEGLAEQFAFKIASGVFGIDLAPQARTAGIGTHLAYGGSWGALYGLVQGTFRLPPAAAGPLFGLLVWLVGPGLLVPAMKLMLPPHREPPMRLAMLVAGHVVYGLCVAGAYELLEREVR